MIDLVLGQIVREKLSDLFSKVPSQTIFGNGGPYLTRYRLLDFGKRVARVYVHQFHRSDEDKELHSHPWQWGLALILRGGYTEFRADNATRIVKCRVRLPGSLVFLRHDTFHRVELLKEESWSLIVVGPVRHAWHFLDAITGEKTHWREFIRRKGLEPV